MLNLLKLENYDLYQNNFESRFKFYIYLTHPTNVFSIISQINSKYTLPKLDLKTLLNL